MRISAKYAVAGAAIALGVAVAGTVAAQQAIWANEGELPVERSEAAAVSVNGRIYVISGNSPGNQANALVHEYDMQDNSVRDRAPMPDIASHAGAAAVNGKIYVVGGFVANVHMGAHNRVFEYDPAANTWRAVAPLPTPRGSVAVAALNGKIHAIGGRNPDRKTVADHHVYDPATNAWTAAAPLPVARDHAGIAVVPGGGGRIHVFGGRTDAQGDNVGRHDIYNPATNTWTEGAPMPTPRSAGAYGYVSGRIVYAGGECKDTTARTTYNELEVYDPQTNSWSSLGTMPAGRHAAAGVVQGAVFYVFGGNNGCGGEKPLKDVIALRLPRR